MKKEIAIQVIKVEDIPAVNLRRQTYALTRDQKNNEFNDAIAARLLADIKLKCDKCGREFTTKKTSESQLFCPDCR